MPSDQQTIGKAARDRVRFTKTPQGWARAAAEAIQAAEAMGHTMTEFPRRSGKRTPDVRTASCVTCGGCCWVGFYLYRGFAIGGRLLKYKCGTPEAAGFKSVPFSDIRLLGE